MYGHDEPAHPALRVISAVFGASTGVALGVAAFLLATFFPALLRTALPGMSNAVFVTLWCGALAVPVYAFSRALRHGRGWGTRAYATCGIATLLVLFTGELTGAIPVYPWKAKIYFAPGAYERPNTR